MAERQRRDQEPHRGSAVTEPLAPETKARSQAKRLGRSYRRYRKTRKALAARARR